MAMLWVAMACSGEDAAVTAALKVEARDVAFDQTPLAIPAGAEVTVNLTNVGTLEHNWVLVSDAVEPTTATTADAINQAAFKCRRHNCPGGWDRVICL